MPKAKTIIVGTHCHFYALSTCPFFATMNWYNLGQPIHLIRCSVIPGCYEWAGSEAATDVWSKHLIICYRLCSDACSVSRLCISLLKKFALPPPWFIDFIKWLKANIVSTLVTGNWDKSKRDWTLALAERKGESDINVDTWRAQFNSLFPSMMQKFQTKITVLINQSFDGLQVDTQYPIALQRNWR